MKAIMNFKDLKNTHELQTFLEGAQALHIVSLATNQPVTCLFKRISLSNIEKAQKRLVIRFLLQVTGYFRQQLTCLIQQYQAAGIVQQRVVNNPAGLTRILNHDQCVKS